MQDVLKTLWEIRQGCETTTKELSVKYAMADEEVPLSALHIAFNHATICLELTSHYFARWERTHALKEAVQRAAVEQSAQRVNEATKSLFLFSLSAFEYGARTIARAHPEVLELDFDQRQYLIGIMRASEQKELIDWRTYTAWRALSDFRNVIVHNNGIGERNIEVPLPDGPVIRTTRDEPIEGDLLTFPDTVRWAVGAYAGWCDAFLSARTSV